MRLSKLEQETIINYNQEEKEASIWTCDRKMIDWIERLRKKDKNVKLVRKETYGREYELPKSYIIITHNS